MMEERRKRRGGLELRRVRRRTGAETQSAETSGLASGGGVRGRGRETGRGGTDIGITTARARGTGEGGLAAGIARGTAKDEEGGEITMHVQGIDQAIVGVDRAGAGHARRTGGEVDMEQHEYAML